MTKYQIRMDKRHASGDFIHVLCVTS